MKFYEEESVENQSVENESFTEENNQFENNFGHLKNKVTSKVTKKAAKATVRQSTLMASIGPIILWILIILIILTVLIGIIMFFITMPGMVMEKIKAVFEKLGSYVAAFFGADTTEQISDVRIYETLDYLEDMGYDLKGYGFLTDYYKSTSDIGANDLNADESANGMNVDEDIGVVRDDDGNIILAKSDFIFTYIASDNYVYTLKNDNIATNSDERENWFTNAIRGFFTGWYKVKNYLFSPLYDFAGITNSALEKWGKGLIMLYYDDGSIGGKGNAVNSSTLWNWDTVKMNLNNKTLHIKKRTLFNNNNAIEYSLDGWTGRYGMPVEFLLSVHMSTMMPDLAYDMATAFPTTVNVYLHDVSKGNVDAAYRTNSGKYITYDQLANTTYYLENEAVDYGIYPSTHVLPGEQATNDCNCTYSKYQCYYDSDGERHIIVDKVKNVKNGFFTSIVRSDEEQYNPNNTSLDECFVYKDGFTYVCIVNSEDIVEEDLSEFVCPNCTAYVYEVYNYLQDLNDDNFGAYFPYIANVKNHWYRDVYFVLDESKELEFVNTDYEYEILMKERWSLYETYPSDPNKPDYKVGKAGEYKLYLLDDSGEYADSAYYNTLTSEQQSKLEAFGNYYLYMGTKNDAEKDNLVVSKKSITIDASNNEELKDLGWNYDQNNRRWSAYVEGNTTSSTSYEKVYSESDIENETNPIKKEIKDRLYVDMQISAIVQTGEGQRTETNPEIKKMFLSNTYFRYDGSQNTAEVITELRKKIKENELQANGIEYGPLNKLIANSNGNIVDVTENSYILDVIDKNNPKEYKISDYSGQVTLNQDSLNAFSMLENTHTLDADYIYRDFKELIVELGYFSKEELTDETPKLLQWLVPDTGSRGYPDRTIDKRENEYGTMIHSKGDIDANAKNSLTLLYEEAQNNQAMLEAEKQVESGTGVQEPNVSTSEGATLSQVSSSELNNFVSSSLKARASSISGVSSNIERIPESGDGYAYKINVDGVEYTHYYQFSGSYAGKNFTHCGETKTIARAGCGFVSCVNLLTGYGVDITPEAVVGTTYGSNGDIVRFMEKNGVKGEWISSISDAEFETIINQALSEGKPVITLMRASKGGDIFWTKDGHYVAIVGVDSEGNMITADTGSSSAGRHTYEPGVAGAVKYVEGVFIPEEPPKQKKMRMHM